MEQLRIQRNNLYIIEVNDEGDTITIDIEDVELPLKYQRMMEKIQKLQQQVKGKTYIQDKNKKDGDFVFNKKEVESLEEISDVYKQMRSALDKFFGDGACQKIFGDVNYWGMFEDLFEQLEPHFKNLNLKADTFSKSIKEKYKVKDNDVLV